MNLHQKAFSSNQNVGHISYDNSAGVSCQQNNQYCEAECQRIGDAEILKLETEVNDLFQGLSPWYEEIVSKYPFLKKTVSY